MILYMSNATNYATFDRLLSEGKLANSFQMQKFNDNLIRGLSQYEDITALSVLPYNNIYAARIEQTVGNIHYIGVENHAGKMRKIGNVLHLLHEGVKVIHKNNPRYILCDAIAASPCYTSVILGKLFKIPTIGIITDFPGMLQENKVLTQGIWRMQKFDAYVLLTEAMNGIVNPKGKSHMVMEGLCAPVLPPLGARKMQPRIILYTGSLWKKDAGIEYLVDGFLQANIPNCELHFYGVGELIPWIEEIGKKHPNVKYMGSVTNKEILKKQAEATLLVNPRPSDEEFCKYSFPSKTIEYMASGTPVLMTRLPGVPEEYFQYVYTIDRETAMGACQALRVIFEEEEKRLFAKGITARQFVAEQKNCAVQTKRVFDFCTKLTESFYNKAGNRKDSKHVP